MREPAPREIPPPSHGEPTLRVGVIIPGDARRSLQITILKSGVSAHAGDIRIPLERQTTYTVEPHDDGCGLRHGSSVLIAGSTLTLQSEPGLAASLEINSVVAGRGFHWKKDVTLQFPGSFEFTRRGDELVAINILPFEDYLACVISSEMGKECPPEFLKAQAIAARSWAWVFLQDKHPGEGFDVCNDDDCQRYQGTTFASEESLAVCAKTRGRYLVDDRGFVCPAYYSKCCGGVSELTEFGFGFSVPELESVYDGQRDRTCDLRTEEAFENWLRVKTDGASEAHCSEDAVPTALLPKYLGSVDITRPYYRWSEEIPGDKLRHLLATKAGLASISRIEALVPLERGMSGRITSLAVDFVDSHGNAVRHVLRGQYNIRKTLSDSFLLSSAFSVAYTSQGVRLDGLGWGHGVGLCQIGGVGMALKGETVDRILARYFPRYRLERIYD